MQRAHVWITGGLTIVVAIGSIILGTAFRDWANTVRTAIEKVDHLIVMVTEQKVMQSQDEIWKKLHTQRPHEEATRRIDRLEVMLENEIAASKELRVELFDWNKGLRASLTEMQRVQSQQQHILNDLIRHERQIESHGSGALQP